MLPRVDITGTRPLTRVEVLAPTSAAGDPRQEAFSRLAQIAIGRQLQGTVLSRLDDGTFLVRVAETPARMALPAGTDLGDRLDLTLVSRDPRPTFLLGRAADSISGSATASFSAAGRLINNVLQDSQQQGAPMTLVGKTPLLSSPAINVPQLAAVLQGALAFSGLFYESHVGQWAGGTRKLADLLREPQAKNTAPHHASVHGGNNIEPARRLLDAEPVSAAPDKATLEETGPEQQALPLGAESSRLVSMQLDVLEQRRVLWQGELWKGQALEWEVSEEAPQHDQEDGERAWHSTVRFTLPTLGAVTATIRLADGRVQVHACTASEEAAASLRMHGDMLAGALGAAGSSLELLTVKLDESI